ncbi:unnamed protein product [Miscanthus lutarioriparius]|uniref:Transcription factor n=1 Tax=Miscanthus lutarioriparius TaxID=422564 RepID=A0A811R4E5_9POAL|nr:unnamed protein product [Miscanthus lutarioriparius]
MDELVFPASSSSCPSPASFSNAGHHQEHEFVPCDVLEGWLGGDDWLDEPPKGVKVTWGGEGSRSPGNDHLSGEPAAPALKRRGRKPGSRNNINGPALCPVEAERQRRDKLNRLFCELRAAVPTVSRMDKASVLADATTYIAQLRQRVEQLEVEAKKKSPPHARAPVAGPDRVARVRVPRRRHDRAGRRRGSARRAAGRPRPSRRVAPQAAADQLASLSWSADWAGPIHAQRKPSPPRTTAQIPHDLLISHLPLSRSRAFLLRTCLIERADGGMSDRGAFPALHSGTGARTAADGANGEGGSRWGRMGLAVESAAADVTERVASLSDWLRLNLPSSWVIP